MVSLTSRLAGDRSRSTDEAYMTQFKEAWSWAGLFTRPFRVFTCTKQMCLSSEKTARSCCGTNTLLVQTTIYSAFVDWPRDREGMISNIIVWRRLRKLKFVLTKHKNVYKVFCYKRFIPGQIFSFCCVDSCYNNEAMSINSNEMFVNIN